MEERAEFEGWTCWHCKQVVLLRCLVVRDGKMDSRWESFHGEKIEHKAHGMECPACWSNLINTPLYVRPFTP